MRYCATAPVASVPPPPTTTYQIEVAGLVFVDTNSLLSQLEQWHRELTAVEYSDILDTVAGQLADASSRQAEHTEIVPGSFYALAERTREDFNRYKRTARFRHIWAPIEQALSDAFRWRALGVSNSWRNLAASFLEGYIYRGCYRR